MPTWQEIGVENFQAALNLYDGARQYRSATSRFYYASFSILTHELIRRHAEAEFTGGRETPGHGQLPHLIEVYFTHFSSGRALNLARLVRSLYRDRIAADYSLLRVDKQSAKASYRAAEKIFEYMGVSHERK